MNETTHAFTTQLALMAAKRIGRLAFPGQAAEKLIQASAATDAFQDMEFVNVHSQRDDPHQFEWQAANDQPHYLLGGQSLTALNHFIDLRKSSGQFDDYDGYSYYHGSARQGEYQPADQMTGGFAHLLAGQLGFKVDQAFNYWLNDEYVHAPGHPWYRHCSPALEHYSYPREFGIYPDQRKELQARFPQAEGRGHRGQGVPYSVFFPVDNLARYWWDRFLRNAKLKAEYLGPVLHAIQDASIPHHAAGTLGNWHGDYESSLEKHAAQISRQPVFQQRLEKTILTWMKAVSPSPAGRITYQNLTQVPSRKWKIDQLVTWTAWHAYQDYVKTYHHFKRGFKINANRLTRLYLLATAMSAFVLLLGGQKHRKQHNH